MPKSETPSPKPLNPSPLAPKRGSQFRLERVFLWFQGNFDSTSGQGSDVRFLFKGLGFRVEGLGPRIYRALNPDDGSFKGCF